MQDKKILFFAPKFFGYEKDVLNELTARNAEVYFLPDRPSDNAVLKVIYRISPNLLKTVSDNFYMKSIKSFNVKYYDFVFIQSGEALTIKLLTWLKNKYPFAKFIFYTYDSIENKKGQLEKIKFCDVSYTFDKTDAKKYNINYRPLFFSQGFEKENLNANKNTNYDLSFIGTAHSDRHEVIKKIKANLDKNIKIFIFLYLQTKWLYWLRKIFYKSYKKTSFHDFNFIPISKKNVQEVFFKSVAILDIEHPKQTGLTMRTFEAIGAGKKLITTNFHIKHEDFYNSKNILILDRLNPIITVDFFKSAYEPLDLKIYNKYKLSTWVSEIFKDSL